MIQLMPGYADLNSTSDYYPEVAHRVYLNTRALNVLQDYLLQHL